MSTSDDHHWSHLEAITDHVSEKTLKESSWNFDNAETPETETTQEITHLAPSISGAIEQFMSKNKDKELSDKQVMYKLHKAVSDQVPDEVMFPTANEIKDAVPESVIPDSVVEKHIPEEQEESQQLDKIFGGIAGGAFQQRFAALKPGPSDTGASGNVYNQSF